MSDKRTEEQIVTQASIAVILGGREFKVVPLVIRYSPEWRKKAIPLIAFLMQYSQETKKKSPEQSVADLFVTKMDEIIESFFEYARELNREEIEGIATDGEILLAFMEVFNSFVAPLPVPPPMKPRKNFQ